MNRNKGFTLVELLAVIVILAVILVIAVPQIMNVITESRKGALASSAKLIASSAETKKVSNDTLGIEDAITCEMISKFNSEDYDSCRIKFDSNGKAKVTIVGKGKFEGMSVCSGTKEDVEVVEECKPTAVEKIENLFETAATENGLIKDDTADQNIRYAGASPKNYAIFNGENWRIIGTFTVTTASGNKEKLLKIVRNTSIGKYSWDSSASSVNGGLGVNQWGASTYTNGSEYEGADLMTMLNTYYIGTSTICSYCSSGTSLSTCSSDCSGSVTPIGSTFTPMIEEVEWNLGAIIWSTYITRKSAYEQERGTATGKNLCTGGNPCNDKVIRTTTWKGKVGLIYPSDFGYASTSGISIIDVSTGTYNWLHNDTDYWTLSPVSDGDRPYLVYRVGSGGATAGQIAFYESGVRPTIYLKSNVSITSGNGSSSNPYQLSM